MQKQWPFLTPAQHGALCTHLERALVSYDTLAANSIADGAYLYKVVPKFHAATQTYDNRLNPRYAHCYADEDMVGRMKNIRPLPR